MPRLDTGQAGIVVRIGNGVPPHRPVVLLLDDLRRAAGTVDLTEKAPSGESVRTIVRAEDPLGYGIRVSRFLLHPESASSTA